LEPEAAQAACKLARLTLENPATKEGEGLYPPFHHLWAPYRSNRKGLFKPLSPLRSLQLTQGLLCADPHARSADARGCG
jgi:hypothetical protein